MHFTLLYRQSYCHTIVNIFIQRYLHTEKHNVIRFRHLTFSSDAHNVLLANVLLLLLLLLYHASQNSVTVRPNNAGENC